MDGADDRPDILCLQGITDPDRIRSWLPNYTVESNKKTLVAWRPDRFDLQMHAGVGRDLTMVQLLDRSSGKVIAAASALFCPDILQVVTNVDATNRIPGSTVNDDAWDCVAKIKEYEQDSYLVVVGASWKPKARVSSVFRVFRQYKYGYDSRNSYFPPLLNDEEDVPKEKGVKFDASVSPWWTEVRRSCDALFAKAFAWKWETPVYFKTEVCGFCGPNRPDNRTSDHLAVVGWWGDDLLPPSGQWIDGLGDDCENS